MTTSSARVSSPRKAKTPATATTTINPCRTLPYALTQVDPGDAHQACDRYLRCLRRRRRTTCCSARKACAAATRPRITSASRTPRPIHDACRGVPDAFRNNFIAHGFMVVDANGDPLPRIDRCPNYSRPPPAPTAGRGHAFPVTTSTTWRRCSSPTCPRSPPAPATCGASSISTTTASTRCWDIATARWSST